MDNLLRLENGQAVARSLVPRLPLELFLTTLTDFVGAGGCLVHFFAYEEEAATRLLAVLRNESLFVAETEVRDSFPSLTAAASTKFHLFEREIAEQYGLTPAGHPWLKMVRYHPNYRGAEDVFGNDYADHIPGNYPPFQVEGEAIHEVAVGPVHAGIIEPGHFRFQCAGEEVLHLEIQLGYQHRGVEKMLPTLPLKRYPVIGEAIAGDTAIGHALCLCQAIEALAGLKVDRAARLTRTIALELERIANHVGDLGALSGDVAFNPPAAYFGRLRGEFLNLLLVLSGNRFGKGLLRPGGVAHVLGEEQRRLLRGKLAEVTPELESVCDLLFTAHTVLARFERCGTVSGEVAAELGLVGPAGRASGLAYDVREAFPGECYGDLPGCTCRSTNGDVLSRALWRREEIRHSLRLIDLLLDRPAEDGAAVPMSEPELRPDAFVVTVNEAWRGEVAHALITGGDGSVLRYKIKDPSFHNWTGLAMALRTQGISDFPLCNKSFNLSYCGFDL